MNPETVNSSELYPGFMHQNHPLHIFRPNLLPDQHCHQIIRLISAGGSYPKNFNLAFRLMLGQGVKPLQAALHIDQVSSLVALYQWCILDAEKRERIGPARIRFSDEELVLAELLVYGGHVVFCISGTGRFLIRYHPAVERVSDVEHLHDGKVVASSYRFQVNQVLAAHIENLSGDYVPFKESVLNGVSAPILETGRVLLYHQATIHSVAWQLTKAILDGWHKFIISHYRWLAQNMHPDQVW